MARQLPGQVRVPAPVVHYVDPTSQQMLYLTPAQLAARQRQDALLYARWRQRRKVQRERDRKLRRFWLGFGATVGLAFLTAMLFVGWLIWTVVGLGVLAVPLVIGLSVVLAAGGHRCITIVQHMH
jgi:sterol desaturase/sphingolipid hydroxylase (fatty acid hydroxylase superfamily)